MPRPAGKRLVRVNGTRHLRVAFEQGSEPFNGFRYKDCQLWNVKQDISELLSSFVKDRCPPEG